MSMQPYYEKDGIVIYHGDCREILPSIKADAVVTDPPYGLAFMGKRWDYDVPSVEIWAECLRVLKPGGHLLAFAGTRTQHRMAVRIEDAGFEIRDMIAWVYGSGFPKSLDVSKAIDKAAGAKREVVGEKGGRYASPKQDFRGGKHHAASGVKSAMFNQITAPATEAARQWQGWGTALKPALEPITVARKPLEGTVAENVLKHGVGGINVDGCRVGTDDSLGGGAQKRVAIEGKGEGWQRPWMHDAAAVAAHPERVTANVARAEALGRWPANLIHDGSDEVVRLFPDAGGGFGKRGGGNGGDWNPTDRHDKKGQTIRGGGESVGYGDTGSAARFFYCAKASKKDRSEGNIHPTVKPTDLMRYLCRLVTPPGGIVLDPFMGSGTTLVAAKLEGRKAIGIELEEEYCEIAAKRLAQGAFSF